MRMHTEDHRPRHARYSRRVPALVIATTLATAGCGSDGTASSSASTEVTTTAAEYLGGSVRARATTIEPTTEASGPPQPDPTEGQPGQPGQPGQRVSTFLTPGDADYSDAIGSAAVRLAFDSSGGISLVTSYDSESGRGHERGTNGGTEFEEWFADGIFLADSGGALVPRLSPSSSVSQLRSTVLRPTIDVEAFEGVSASGTIERDGLTLTEYVFDGETARQRLADRNAESPLRYEYESASFRALVNDAGALVVFESEVSARQRAVPSDFAKTTSTFIVEPLNSPVPETTLPRSETFDDDLTEQLVSMAGLHYVAIVRDTRDPEVGFDEFVADWNDEPLATRYDLEVGEPSSASEATIGYDNGIAVLRSPSGRWFCVGYSDPLAGQFAEQGKVTGFSDDAEGAVAACAQQR